MKPKYTVTKRSIYYNVGRYRLDNKADAEHLAETLNTLTQNQTTNTETDKTLDMVQKKVIQLQMSVAIIAEELEALHRELIQ